MTDLRRAAAIVGVYEHPTRYAPDKSELQIQGESVIKALEDAGLGKKDVDALFAASMGVRLSSLSLADYLDMDPVYMDNTTVGGSSFEFHVAHALSAIATGRINCAVITYGSVSRSGGVAVGTGGLSRQGHTVLQPSPDSFEELYGLTTVGTVRPGGPEAHARIRDQTRTAGRGVGGYAEARLHEPIRPLQEPHHGGRTWWSPGTCPIRSICWTAV